jgi:para-nitrobenzyl esterase
MTAPKETVEVATSKGLLRGEREGSLDVFRGFPYAKPPVGELRLRAPQEAPGWDGALDATRFGAAPPQPCDAMAERLGLFPSEPQSEDCLTLNVWTPGVGDGSRPVMVWIHGGAFLQGAGSVPLYSGARLAERCDVVVVTLNYRVGALGFLCLEGEERGANFGLQDQIAALAWVKREIARFGGDPERVTVFGESAGAGSITSLLAIPEARSSFGRAIIQSAAPGGMLDRAEAERRTSLLLAKLGLEARDFAKLRSLPLSAISQAQSELAAEGPYEKGMLFMPVVDGEVLAQFPLEAVGQGSAAAVDVMIGTTRDEMRLFNLINPTAGITDALLEAIVAAQIGAMAEDPQAAAQQIVGRYRDIHSRRGESAAAGDLFCSIQTDLAMRHPSTQLASAQARFNPRTYMYLFDWPSPLDGGAIGACHAVDIAFALGNLAAPGMAEFAGSGAAAEKLAEEVMDAWVAFARHGDPSTANESWPVYEADARRTMRIAETWETLEAPLEEERQIFEALATRG